MPLFILIAALTFVAPGSQASVKSSYTGCITKINHDFNSDSSPFQDLKVYQDRVIYLKDGQKDGAIMIATDRWTYELDPKSPHCEGSKKENIESVFTERFNRLNKMFSSLDQDQRRIVQDALASKECTDLAVVNEAAVAGAGTSSRKPSK